jgi:FMN phosphatase YigB (HAD superfamily)
MMRRRADKPVIVLDVGGVLVGFDLKPLIGALSKDRGEKVVFPPLANIDRLFLPVQTGEASLDDMVPELNASLGVSMAPSEWHALSCSIFTGEVPGMKEVLLQLKTDFLLVALTNTVDVHWTFLLKTYDILKLMDGCIVSYLEGAAKPDPAIYQMVVDRTVMGIATFSHRRPPEYGEGLTNNGDLKCHECAVQTVHGLSAGSRRRQTGISLQTKRTSPEDQG